jgi:hypothetical protein
MVDADTPEPLSNKDLKGLAKTMLAREGGIMGIVVAVAPIWGILSAVLFMLHVWFYLANLTAALAVMSVTGSSLIVVALAGSVLVARRAVGREPAQAS